MEPNQVNPSPATSGIPQGIPTGVFVPNNQTPVPSAQVQNTVQQPAATPAKEGPLDRIFKWLARSLAKVTGQPDPITGVANPTTQAMQKWQNIVGKVRGAANQAVAKATNVAGQAVNTASNVAGKAVNTATNVAGKAINTTTTVVNQATQQVKQIVPPITAPASQPTPEQPK